TLYPPCLENLERKSLSRGYRARSRSPYALPTSRAIRRGRERRPSLIAVVRWLDFAVEADRVDVVSQQRAVMDPLDRKAELERRLRRALVLPAGIVFVLAVILGVQVERRVDYQQWVEHSEQVLAKLADLHKEVLDQETGLRAYLLTDDEKFLEAYRRGLPAVQLDELEKLVADNPSSQARLGLVRQRYETWRSSRAARILANPEDARQLASVREGKQLMDSLRAAIFGLQAAELDLRRDRVEAARASLLATRIAFV